MQAGTPGNPQETGETVGFGGLTAKLNWLRAAVLGANDGVVSGAGITIGVTAADPTNLATIMLAGVAGMLAGASAMAMGEYVSVSSQRDTEEALIAKERHALEHTPEGQFDELVEVYRRQGLSDVTARTVAEELTAHNPLAAHLRAEYGCAGGADHRLARGVRLRGGIHLGLPAAAGIHAAPARLSCGFRSRSSSRSSGCSSPAG